MRKIIITMLTFIFLILVSSCPTPDSLNNIEKNQSSTNSFTNFSINSIGANGIIGDDKVTIYVASSTDLENTSFIANFTHHGSKVKIGNTEQISGITSNNFKNSKLYSVSAENGTIKDYFVILTKVAAEEKEIRSFTITNPAAIGMISGTNITIDYPIGTDVTTLVPNFFYKGSSIRIAGTDQISGVTANDFTNPLTYVVTDGNGVSINYIVTVNVATLPGSITKNISSFGFSSPSAASLISGQDIAITVPFGTNLTNLIANFTTDGTLVEIGSTAQTSGSNANDFTNPVLYKVTAENGSVRNYTVNVTVTPAPSSDKAITAFSFTSPAETGVFTGTNIAVTVPAGTDVSALVATFTTNGASIEIASTAQASGITTNDFTNPLIYKVTAADNSVENYTVTVYVAAVSSDKDITAFNFSSPSATAVISGTNIDLDVPFGTNLTNLVATFTTTGSSITVSSVNQTSGTTVNDFTAPVTYRVTADDASTKDYTVTVNISAASSDKDITAFSFSSPSATAVISGTTINIEVPYGSDVDALIASFTTTGSSVTVSAVNQTSGTTTNDFTAPVTYRVTAADTSTLDYTVTVSFLKAAIEDNDFTTGTNSGDSAVLTLSETSDTLKMIYVNDQINVNFPISQTDSATAQLDKKIWMAETETTNEIVAAVFQWAYDDGRFSANIADHNGLDTGSVKYGTQILMDIGNAACFIGFDGAGTFTVNPGYENKPAVFISWYGAIMISNWLTEMRDGNTSNVVYSGITATWDHNLTIEDATKNGYRLPQVIEWEYAARYRGSDPVNTVVGFSSPYFTKGHSASGSTFNSNSAGATGDVAYYSESTPSYTEVQIVKGLTPNALAMYDMSGNALEWCFSKSGSNRDCKGGHVTASKEFIVIGKPNFLAPTGYGSTISFRLCRTTD